MLRGLFRWEGGGTPTAESGSPTETRCFEADDKAAAEDAPREVDAAAADTGAETGAAADAAAAAEGAGVESKDLKKEGSPSDAPHLAAFHQLPSVCTWFQPRFYVPRRDAAQIETEAERSQVEPHVEPVQVETQAEILFCLKPSVGTWYMLLRMPAAVAEEAPEGVPAPPVVAKTVDEPWQTDFEAFTGAPEADAKLADSAETLTPATTSLGESPFSPLAAFKTELPPVPATDTEEFASQDDLLHMTRMRSAMLPSEVQEVRAFGTAGEITRKRSALINDEDIPQSVNIAKDSDVQVRARMRSAIPRGMTAEEFEEKQVDDFGEDEDDDAAGKAEREADSDKGELVMSRMRSATIPPEAIATDQVAPAVAPGAAVEASPEAEEESEDKQPPLCRMRSALVPEDALAAGPAAQEVMGSAPAEEAPKEAESNDEIPMSRMRSALIPPDVMAAGPAAAKTEEVGCAAPVPAAVGRGASQAEETREEVGGVAPASAAVGRTASQAEEMEEEVVAPGAGQFGVPLARGGRPPAPGGPSTAAPLPKAPPAPPVPPAPSVQPSPSVPIEAAHASVSSSSVKELDHMVGSSLDQFFGDDRNWKKVGREIASSTKATAAQRRAIAGTSFRIQVPKPYPGVQYRKSKCLDDRYPRFAENGTVVSGRVEDGGEWLKVGDNIYLPMRVGAVRIMEPMPGQASPSVQRSGSSEGFWSWLACCKGERASAESEVVVNPTADEGSQSSGGSSLNPPVARGSSPPRAQAPSIPTPNMPGPAVPVGSGANMGSPLAGGGRAPPPPPPLAEDVDPPRPTPLPEDISRNPLSNLDAANRHFSSPINPFADTTSAAGGMSPSKRRTEARHHEDQERRRPEQINDVFQA
mmetsp:Transcript_45255/g.141874  ORF Transcript_45255/g.141874 Transcript_45255/m.141874 type:complete len:868 (-) Transcript_45255:116-2719(-)